MQKPDESLDDYVVKAMIEIPTEPPRAVSLRFTGEIEVVKPLARWEGPAKVETVAVEKIFQPASQGLSWFHRSLAVGGAFAVIAFMLLSAILIGINENPRETALAPGYETIERQPDENLASAEEPLASDIFSTDGPILATPDVSSGKDPNRNFPYRIRHASFRRLAKPRIQRAAFRPRRRMQQQPVVADFVPTTLVIYTENGEIKSRIEPQLTAGLKKTPTFSN